MYTYALSLELFRLMNTTKEVFCKRIPYAHRYRTSWTFWIDGHHIFLCIFTWIITIIANFCCFDFFCDFFSFLPMLTSLFFFSQTRTSTSRVEHETFTTRKIWTKLEWDEKRKRIERWESFSREKNEYFMS